MNIFIRLVILFIFIYITISANFLKIPQNDLSLESTGISNAYWTNDPLKFKGYIFLSVSMFEFFFTIGLNFYRSCPIKFKTILKNSVQSGLLAVVAHSVYQDMITKEYKIVKGNEYFTVSVMVTIFIAISYLIELSITNYDVNRKSCLNRSRKKSDEMLLD